MFLFPGCCLFFCLLTTIEEVVLSPGAIGYSEFILVCSSMLAVRYTSTAPLKLLRLLFVKNSSFFLSFSVLVLGIWTLMKISEEDLDLFNVVGSAFSKAE